MGIIQQQSFQDFIVTSVGIAIGIISMLFVYPLNHELYGFFNTIYSGSQLLLPIISLGAARTAVNFFKKSKDSRGAGVLGFCMLLNLAGFILASGILIMIHLFQVKNIGPLDITIFYEYSFEVLIIALALGLTSTLTGHISNYGKITIPTILVDLSYKIFIPTLILVGYIYQYESGSFVGVYTGFFVLVLGAMVVYGKSLKALILNIPKSIPIKSLLNYSLYSTLGVLGGIVAFKIDAIMISGLLDFSSTGLYFNILVMTNTIAMANNTIAKISGPVISNAMSEKDYQQVSEIYKKSSINSLIIGLLIFLGLWFNLENLFSISSKPEVFAGALNIFIILGLAKLFDISTSVNNPIIQYSSFYRYNLLFIGILGLSNIIFNLIFIEKYGLVGAAMATGLSFFLYNLIKLIFIKWKFDLIPFTLQTIKLSTIALFFILIKIFMPQVNPGFIALVLTSVALLFGYISLVYYYKISLDFNSLLRSKVKSVLSF